jgi:predicted amino acid-binding ACT domain protein
MTDFIITVMARDRVGIVRDVSSALAGLGSNITRLSETVVRGYFTLIISVQVPDERTASELRQAVRGCGAPGELEVGVKPYVEQPVPDEGVAEHFTLTMRGADQPGIIARTTAYLAENGINIDDFYCYVHEGILLMLAEVSIPSGIDVEAVQAGLESVGGEFGLLIHLQHENIFRATSEVRPVRELAEER